MFLHKESFLLIETCRTILNARDCMYCRYFFFHAACNGGMKNKPAANPEKRAFAPTSAGRTPYSPPVEQQV